MQRIKYFLLWIVCFFVGHDWSDWEEFHHVPTGGTGFITLSEKNNRDCTRCWQREHKEWSDEEKKLLQGHYVRIGSKLDGYVGELYGVRFIQSTATSTMNCEKLDSLDTKYTEGYEATFSEVE